MQLSIHAPCTIAPRSRSITTHEWSLLNNCWGLLHAALPSSSTVKSHSAWALPRLAMSYGAGLDIEAAVYHYKHTEAMAVLLRPISYTAIRILGYIRPTPTEASEIMRWGFISSCINHNHVMFAQIARLSADRWARCPCSCARRFG